MNNQTDWPTMDKWLIPWEQVRDPWADVDYESPIHEVSARDRLLRENPRHLEVEDVGRAAVSPRRLIKHGVGLTNQARLMSGLIKRG